MSFSSTSNIPYQSSNNFESINETIKSKILNIFEDFQITGNQIWKSRKPYEKILIIILFISVGIFAILLIIYHKTVLDHVIQYSDDWKDKILTLVLLSSGIFLVSFAPLIGFSLLNTIVGVIYEVSFKGWLIIALSSISGSVISFLLFRHFFKNQALNIVQSHEKLMIFSEILKENNSFWILAMIRLCPLPYSLTNAALAGIPGVSVGNFFLGSAISSPKLAMYLIIGSKLKHIGDERGLGSKILDVLSIFLTMMVVVVTGYVLYEKMTKKLNQQNSNMDIDGEQLQNLVHDEDDFLIEDFSIQ